MRWRIEMLGGFCVQRGDIAVTRFRTHKAAALLAYLALNPRRQHAREELADRFWPDVGPEAARLSLRAALSTLRRLLDDSETSTAPLFITYGNHSIALHPDRFETDTAAFETAIRSQQWDTAKRLYIGPLLPGFYEDWALSERERLDALAQQIPAAPSPSPFATLSTFAALPESVAAATDSLRPALRLLPAENGCLFGRDEEINQLGALLRDPTVRFVTLLGPGGIGKTRLAIAAAQRFGSLFPGGVLFVPLAECTDARQLLPAIRDRFCAAGNLDRAPHTDPLETITALLQDRPVLLVLDNLEQMAAGSAVVLQTLSARLPELTCLLTSRRRLGLSAEKQMTVAPLSDAAAQRLFVDRAGSANPDFQCTERNRDAIAALCRDLEGIPLAIELAAARAGSLSPAEMHERLKERFVLLSGRQRDKSARHRSLWAAMEWSHRLLTPEQQRLFARLSVFRGGWTTDAAEIVCEEPSALEYLSQLRERSLLYTQQTPNGQTRWQMLESLREFAAEQIAVPERETCQQRHIAYFCERAEKIAPLLNTPAPAAHLDTLENDHANFRAALEYAKEHQTGDAFPSRLAAALWRFWQIRGHYAEGRAALASALSEESNAATAERTILLLGAGTLAYEQGDSEIAEESFTAGLLAAKVNGDRLIEAKIRTTFGLIRLRQGRYTEARTTVETALALFRECGDQRGESAALTNLGLSYFREGRFAEARPYYEAALTIDRALQDWRGVAQMQNNLGNLAACTGQYDEARRCHEESLALKRSLGDQAGIVSSLNNLGIVAMYQGCLDEARALQQEALRLRLHLGLRHGIRESLINVAAIACRTGEYERAVCLWGAAEAMDSALDIPTTAPAEASEEARARRDALQALGQGRYAAALQRGRCLSPESAAAVALQPSRSSLL